VKPLATAVVFDPAPASAEPLRALLLLEHGVRVLVARTWGEARSLAVAEAADLVVAGAGAADADAHAMCRALRDERPVSDLELYRATPARDTAARDEALRQGFDGVLDWPADAAAALSVLRAVLRLKRMREEVERQRAELDGLHASARRGTEQVVDLLTYLLETTLPGAVERGRRAAALCGQLAARFGVPERLLRDLEIASHLRELGRLPARTEVVEAAVAAGEDWPHVVATRSLLLTVDGLRGAAEVVGAVHENWDGTGHPDHRIAGQIPLRSRILRVVSDFLAEYERSPRRSPDEVIEGLREHGGTRYDPMVLVHLEALVQKDRESARSNPRIVVPVPALRTGMVLAEDLYTDSGLKLLARGTTLTPAALETILRRHQMEPILHGAAVFRDAA
jgi:response regulator RpfG family c-di-GMP phosphodiesterase